MKVRKPQSISFNNGVYDTYVGCINYHPEDQLSIDISAARYDLKHAKKLHKWLGQAIAYLEQKK